jgi:hypothetical protein
MIPVTGFPFSGDQPKAKVELRLSGLTDGQYYLLGDHLTGEIIITPQQDIQLRSISVRLDYLIKGKLDTALVRAATVHLRTPDVLKGGQATKFPVRINYYFPRVSYKGQNLVSYWRLNVFLDYDNAQFGPSFVERVSNVFTGEQRHGTSFEVWVKYGKGTYVVAPQELPIGLIDFSALFLPIALFIGFSAIGAIGRDFQDWLVMPLFFLVLFIGWLFVRLSTFQMTPMEIKPLRDGQLRLRILDRGNGQLKKAIVGYRLLERCVVKNGEHESTEVNTVYRKSFPFEEVSRREGHLYEALLPWPEIDLPTSGVSGRVGYDWEVFLLVPNPLTGGMHDKSWPIKVGWERLRLELPTPEELKQEELEVLKLKELEHLTKT